MRIPAGHPPSAQLCPKYPCTGKHGPTPGQFSRRDRCREAVDVTAGGETPVLPHPGLQGLPARAGRAFLRLRSRPLPPGSDLASKIALGLARVYLCMGISGTAERWEDARQEYAFILAEYERGSTRLRRSEERRVGKECRSGWSP